MHPCPFRLHLELDDLVEKLVHGVRVALVNGPEFLFTDDLLENVVIYVLKDILVVWPAMLGIGGQTHGGAALHDGELVSDNQVDVLAT